MHLRRDEEQEEISKTPLKRSVLTYCLLCHLRLGRKKPFARGRGVELCEDHQLVPATHGSWKPRLNSDLEAEIYTTIPRIAASDFGHEDKSCCDRVDFNIVD